MLVPDTVQAPGESGVGIFMTTYHGSVKRMSGHILVSTANLVRVGSDNVYYSWTIEEYKIKNTFLDLVPYGFTACGGKIYYTNGRKQVYETDISDIRSVLFNPVGLRLSRTKGWERINFTLISKVEWVFL
jgi:hypothetical protein